MAARDGVRQREGCALDGGGAGAAAGHPLSRPADRHRVRRHARDPADPGVAVSPVPDLAGRRRRCCVA